MPKQIIKKFIGAMDLDSANEVIGRGWHREAWNGRFNGPKGDERFEAIEGNSLVAGQESLTDGTDLTIGTFYDKPNGREFFFNWNPAGNHGIYIFNKLSGIFQTLMKIGVTTNDDILNFTADWPITEIGIIYGDPQEGDLLCFLDSLGRPTRLNIQRYLAVAYGLNVPRSYINVIKAPPIFPPRVVYENDTTVTANNLLNSLFKFAYSYIDDDNSESVISSGSNVPLPTTLFSGSAGAVVSQDARIGIFLNTGASNIKKFRIYMKQTQNGSTSDWMVVDTIDKEVLGLADGGIYKYFFYNDGNYVVADPTFTNRDFDYVPLSAEAQAILNGNTLSYGNITEGYDWIPSEFSENMTNSLARNTIPGFIFFADYDGTFTGGQPNIKLVLAGAGPNDPVTGNPTSLPNHALTYFVNAMSGTTDISFSSNYSLATVAGILSQIQSDAVGAGWSVAAPTDANSIRIYYPTGNVVLKSSRASLSGGPGLALLTNNPRFAHYEGAVYSYGVKYFDENGITNGVITDVTGNISTLATSAAQIAPLTSLVLNLSGIIPPDWARSYAVVRTDNITYSKYLNWVSNRTISGTGNIVLDKYAYIDISNIDTFNEKEQASQNVVKYGFEQGDRIRFNAIYKVDSTTTTMHYDYSIIGFEINPVVNGQPQVGRFIKIAYPTVDIAANPNFGFSDNYNFQNYNITIYHIALTSKPTNSTSSGNVYYEVGVKFGIGNPGLPTAYHFGNQADNRVLIEEGDIFYRPRTVPCSNTYFLYSGEDDFSDRYVTFNTRIQPTPDVFTPLYTVSSQVNLNADAFNPAVYPKFSDFGGLLVNNSLGFLNVRLRGSIQITATDPQGGTWADIVVKKVGPTGTTVGAPFILVHSDPVAAAQTILIDFDQTIQLESGWKMWLIFGNGETRNVVYSGFMLRMDIIRDITISVYDPSYSDVYNLVTNADNRPSIEDREARQLQYGTRYRWSLAYQLDTVLNRTNQFYFLNSDEASKMYGDIQAMSVVGTLLHFFFYRKCGTTGVYQKYIKNNTGSDQLIVNNEIIQKNNIHYAVYDGGVGNQKSSIVLSNYAHYFVDPVKGYNLRWSGDGVIPISVLYKSQTWFGQNAPKYLDNYTYQFGGNARIFGAFKVVADNNAIYISMFQGGTNASNQTIVGRAVIFDETDNHYECFWNLNADAIIVIENVLYTFFHGKLYIHNNTTTYANFFGVQYPVSIDLVWNEEGVIKKKYMALAYQSNQFMLSPNVGDIITNTINPQTGLQQESRLRAYDGEIQETGNYFAFLKDANSMPNQDVAVNEGDFLGGNWIETHMEYSNGEYVFLYAPYILFTLSGRNL